MKKVLIALDYNPVSEKVAEQGYEMAQKIGAKVGLVHVESNIPFYQYQYPAFLGYQAMPMDFNLASEMRKMTEDYLKSAAKHLNDPSIETFLVEGDTAPAILDHAEKWNADMIVMGTHSHSVMEKLIMGTVASKVLEKTKIPVYMIPVKK